MIILADENIPLVREAFGGLGEVRILPGRQMDSASAKDADVLLVRSVTRVNQSLLEASNVRFVGSATIGTDHIDLDWLAQRGIAFSSAPGSNAESVAQYVAAALVYFRAKLGWRLNGKTIGIVGAGHCGSRVARVARALGMGPMLCDPPLKRSGDLRPFHPLSELADCDAVSLHVPLTSNGKDRTVGMIGAEFLGAMKSSGVLINAARGGIVDETALLKSLRSKQIAGAAIDAWIGEPEISVELMKAATLATPHVAGYSADGKLRATQMIYEALCRHLNKPVEWNYNSRLPTVIRESEIATGGDREKILTDLISDSYPLPRDDEALRKLEAIPVPDRGSYFDQLRKNYPERREFSVVSVFLKPPDAVLNLSLAALGFTMATSD